MDTDTKDEMIELIFDLFNQGCRFETKEGFHYDHMFISTYEEAQSFLLKVGKITQKECHRKW